MSNVEILISQLVAAENVTLGTIHKQRRQFFWIFDTPLPHIGSFLVPSVSNFDQFLSPPPSQLSTSFMDGPEDKKNTLHKVHLTKLYNIEK